MRKKDCTSITSSWTIKKFAIWESHWRIVSACYVFIYLYNSSRIALTLRKIAWWYCSINIISQDKHTTWSSIIIVVVVGRNSYIRIGISCCITCNRINSYASTIICICWLWISNCLQICQIINSILPKVTVIDFHITSSHACSRGHCENWIKWHSFRGRIFWLAGDCYRTKSEFHRLIITIKEGLSRNCRTEYVW